MGPTQGGKLGRAVSHTIMSRSLALFISLPVAGCLSSSSLDMCSKVVLEEYTGFLLFFQPSEDSWIVLTPRLFTMIKGQERRTSMQRYTRIGTHDRITGTDSDESDLGH
jgi:hypothetical protein